jgi:hypothetical protein
MGKRVNPREKITQSSVGLKIRHVQFLDWARQNKPGFDFNKLVRDHIEEQIEYINPEYKADE